MKACELNREMELKEKPKLEVPVNINIQQQGNDETREPAIMEPAYSNSNTKNFL